MNRSPADHQALLRGLPAVDSVMRAPETAAFVALLGRERVSTLVATVLEEWRAEIRAGTLDAHGLAARGKAGGLVAVLGERVRRESRRGVVRCVNATGVVLNTGLGRAAVHPEVAERMAEAARSYCVLEVDRETNERNQRDDYLGELLARLTGAEAGLGVNNCAGAVMLLFQTFAGGREAIVSRGELVEIGGSFRVPDVMARANARLVEVGTTNRTRIADYERALTERTGLLVKVHTSNFRVVGFVEEVGPAELAALGRARGVVTGYDLGSGLLELAGAEPLQPLLGDEPLVREAVQSGVDLVCFSGDKLLGAPQAGLVVGKREAVKALRQNPIYRALRLDKVALAGLEATLALLLAGRADEIPTRRLLTLAARDLEARAASIARALASIDGFTARVEAGASQPGSGSAPGVLLPTFVVAVTHARSTARSLARDLRQAEPPVFARIADDQVLLDPRTLLAGDEALLVRAFREVAGRA